MHFSRQIIINFIRCALSRRRRRRVRACILPNDGHVCTPRLFSLVFKFSRIAAASERAGETKRFLLHFATRYRGWKLRPNILFYSVFIVPLPLLFSLLTLVLALLLFSPLSLSLSLSRENNQCLNVHITARLVRCISRRFYISRSNK